MATGHYDPNSEEERLRRLEELLYNRKSFSPESKLTMSFTQVISLIIAVFAIGGSYMVTAYSVNHLTDEIKDLKTEIKSLDSSIKDQNDVFEYLILQDSSLITKLPPRLKKKFQ